MAFGIKRAYLALVEKEDDSAARVIEGRPTGNQYGLFQRPVGAANIIRP
jgi:hypothetical protein